MIEVAIVALKASLPNDYPDFVVPFEGQDEKEENEAAQEAADTNTQATDTDIKEENTVNENI